MKTARRYRGLGLVALLSLVGVGSANATEKLEPSFEMTLSDRTYRSSGGLITLTTDDDGQNCSIQLYSTMSTGGTALDFTFMVEFKLACPKLEHLTGLAIPFPANDPDSHFLFTNEYDQRPGGTVWLANPPSGPLPMTITIDSVTDQRAAIRFEGVLAKHPDRGQNSLPVRGRLVGLLKRESYAPLLD
ncbi:MAG: hypothetical protein AAFX44_02385 [Pseudomonadota bacterium]